ncbi:MAG: phosphoribosyl transferase [Deltaproteobacteria bacterium GWA2_57_13]|nr:MAG: phosphoribosyl transferase [Deltaproteobacteria bacterium GWA2_57_13]OGQ84332.1 MAG: phosphoribosyl transferase [Deltaproteobacteria bacterium RIFCSPLOWO2_12_FULL_57_22]
MRFRSREHAAGLLAEKLAQYKGQNPLVLGIPRGAVPMAKIIADALGAELDVVLVHKLGAPGQPELAIGAIDEMGQAYLGDYARALGISADYIREEKEAQLKVLRRRRTLYTPYRPPINPTGRTVIVVDNGIATGATMIAALRTLRGRKPAKLIAAVAVAPPGTVMRIRAEADEVICLYEPEEFFAVGEFFEDFSQVSDEEVVAILRQTRPRRAVGE